MHHRENPYPIWGQNLSILRRTIISTQEKMEMAERKTSSTTTRGSSASGNGSGKTTTRARSSKETGEKQASKQTTAEKQGKETSARSKNAKPKTINLTFNVTVPEETAKMKKPVYVAGNFNQLNNKHADWDTQTHKMKKIDATHYTLTVKGPADTRIEYKYTLGDWDHVELDAHCHDTHNRHITLRGENTEQTVDDVVQNWRNSGK